MAAFLPLALVIKGVEIIRKDAEWAALPLAHHSPEGISDTRESQDVPSNLPTTPQSVPRPIANSATRRALLLAGLCVVNLVLVFAPLRVTSLADVREYLAVGGAYAIGSAVLLSIVVALLAWGAHMGATTPAVVPTGAVVLVGMVYEVGGWVISTVVSGTTPPGGPSTVELFLLFAVPLVFVALCVGIPLLWRDRTGETSSAPTGLFLLIVALFVLWYFAPYWLATQFELTALLEAPVDPLSGLTITFVALCAVILLRLLWLRRLQRHAAVSLVTFLAIVNGVILLLVLGFRAQAFQAASSTGGTFLHAALIVLALVLLLRDLLLEVIHIATRQSNAQAPVKPASGDHAHSRRARRPREGQLWFTAGFTLLIASLIVRASAGGNAGSLPETNLWETTGLLLFGIPLLVTVVVVRLAARRSLFSVSHGDTELIPEGAI